MVKHSHVLLFLLSLLFSLNTMSADDTEKFKVGDLYYQPLAGDPTAVAVTFFGEVPGQSGYSGAITIPSEIAYQGKTYTVKEIAGKAFQNSEIASLTIPTSVTNIRPTAITNCNKLTELNLPDNLTTLDTLAIAGCSNLTHVKLPSSLQRICYRAFEYLPIDSLVIPASVTTIEELAFVGCKKLKKLIISPQNNTYAMINGYLSTKDGKTLVMRLPGDMRTALNISSTVTTVAPYAFWDYDDCPITEVIIPDHVTKIGSHAFGGCRYAKLLNTGNGIKEVEAGAFSHFSRGETLVIGNNVERIGNNGFESFGDQTHSITHPLTISSKIRHIGAEAFYGSAFTEIVLPSDFQVIDSMAFKNMGYLTKVNFPASLREIRYLAFSGDFQLKNITLPSGLTYIGDGAFAGCQQLTEVNIPASVKFIGKRTFSLCPYLIDIVVADDNPNYASEDGVLFTKDFSMLKQYPSGRTDTLYTVPTKVTALEGGCFHSSSRLRRIQLHNGISYFGVGVFQQCGGLKYINLPDNMTYLPEASFLMCGSLTNVNFLPASLKTIGYGAFEQCSGIDSVIINHNIDTIHSKAFYYTARYSYIHKIKVDRRTPPVVVDDKGVGEEFLDLFPSASYGYGTLYVPVGCVDVFRNTQPWSRFKNIVEDSTLGIEGVTVSNDFSVTTADGSISITGKESTEVDIYNIAGMKVWSGKVPAIVTSLQPGIYIVRAGENTVKVRL